jgi:hypothetical protein
MNCFDSKKQPLGLLDKKHFEEDGIKVLLIEVRLVLCFVLLRLTQLCRISVFLHSWKTYLEQIKTDVNWALGVWLKG